MPKIPWADLACEPGKAHLLVAELEPSFSGGRFATDPFDSERLRGVNLMSSVCTRLKLRATYSATTSRAGSGSLVLCVFESRDYRDRVADLVEARASVEDDCEWGSRCVVARTSVAHERLMSVGGESNALAQPF